MKLEERLRRKLRQMGHALNTENSYVQNYHQFLRFIKSKYGEFRHLSDLEKQDVKEFFTYLAVDKNLAGDTQRVALSALKFLCQQEIVGRGTHKAAVSCPV